MSEYKESEAHPEWLESKVHKLTQLVLRQEQTLASLRQDMVMHLFMKNGESGMIPVLCDAATKWRTTKAEEPTRLSYSLKLALFKQLLITLHERLGETSQKEEAMTHAKSLGWMDAEMNWLTLRWDPGQQALEVDSTVRAVPTKVAIPTGVLLFWVPDGLGLARLCVHVASSGKLIQASEVSYSWTCSATLAENFGR